MKEPESDPSVISVAGENLAHASDPRKNKNSSVIPRPSSFFSRWRKTILGTLLVLTGLAMAVFTNMARNLNEPWLASSGAVASLVFALLITILVVPPLTRSAYAEVTRRGLPLDVDRKSV